jgi:hypothetical protein
VTYDPFHDARMQIDDGLGLRARPGMAPQMGGMAPQPGGMVPPMAPHPNPQFGAPHMNAPAPGQAPPIPGMLNINGPTSPLLQLAQLQARYGGAPGMAPQMGGMQPTMQPSVGMMPQHFQEGGLATSIPGDYETHNSDMDFIHDRYDQMHEVAGKFHSAHGGFAVQPGRRHG